MNKELIKRWNEVIFQNDIVYHLSDFGFSPKNKIYIKELILKNKYILTHPSIKIDDDNHICVYVDKLSFYPIELNKLIRGEAK